MNKNIILLFLATIITTMVCAQDDMYFVPTKKEKAPKPKKEVSNVPFAGNTYFIGMNVSDDEYNRRGKKLKSGYYQVGDSIVFSDDSIASDIISFTPVTDSNVAKKERDTMYVFVAEPEDYRYSRYLSLWDDFYFNRWFYGPAWRYVWYPGGPWYDPWFGPWYNPWYDPWFYDYYAWGPYWYPWHYGPYYRNYWYDPYPYHYIAGGGGHHGTSTSRHPGRGGSGGVVLRSTAGTNNNNLVARRNGDVVNRFTGRETTSRGWNSNHNNRGYNDYSRGNNSYSPSHSSGFSGGGYSSGGGFSGGSRSTGGGGHSGGRR